MIDSKLSIDASTISYKLELQPFFRSDSFGLLRNLRNLIAISLVASQRKRIVTVSSVVLLHLLTGILSVGGNPIG